MSAGFLPDSEHICDAQAERTVRSLSASRPRCSGTGLAATRLASPGLRPQQQAPLHTSRTPFFSLQARKPLQPPVSGAQSRQHQTFLVNPSSIFTEGLAHSLQSSSPVICLHSSGSLYRQVEGLTDPWSHGCDCHIRSLSLLLWFHVLFQGSTRVCMGQFPAQEL